MNFRAQRSVALPATAPSVIQATPFEDGDNVRLTSRSLTVKKIFRIYGEADNGWTREQCDMFDQRIEVDAHLRSLLEIRLEAVSRKPWIVLPGGDSDADVEAANMLETALRAVPNFSMTLEHQGTFNWYGWAATEIDWRLVDGAVVPVWFQNVAPQRFRFGHEDDRLLLDVLGSSQGEELLPGKWWVTCRRGRTIQSSGLMRTAMLFSYFCSLGVRDFLVFANRFGIPYVTAKYDPAELTEEKELKDLEKALRDMGTDGYAMMTTAVEEFMVHQVKTAGSGEMLHEQMCNFFQAQLSKLIAGATLLAETGGPGSFALGKVHQSRAFDLLLGDAGRLSETFEQQVGLPFVTFNGMDARPPRLKFHLVMDSDPAARARVFDTALRFGLPLDADQVRNELQLKVPGREAIAAILETPEKPGPDPNQ